MAIPKPASRNSPRTDRGRRVFHQADSVTSRTIEHGLAPPSRAARHCQAAPSAQLQGRHVDRDLQVGRPDATTSWPAARRARTMSPISPSRPSSSARGMKSLAGTRPRWGPPSARGPRPPPSTGMQVDDRLVVRHEWCASRAIRNKREPFASPSRSGRVRGRSGRRCPGLALSRGTWRRRPGSAAGRPRRTAPPALRPALRLTTVAAVREHHRLEKLPPCGTRPGRAVRRR